MTSSNQHTATGSALIRRSLSLLVAAAACGQNVSDSSKTQTPASLAITQQPSTTTAGSPIAPIKIVVRDANGATVEGASVPVTIAIANSPGGGTPPSLNGTTTISSSGGGATFSGLSINKAGSAYTLSVSSAGLTGATTVGFDIAPAPPAALSFVSVPSSVTAGTPFSAQIAIVDNYGNVCTGVPPQSVTIGLSDAATLTGTTTVTSTNGQANFSGLGVVVAGDHGVVVRLPAITAVSPATAMFKVTPGPASALVFTGQPSNTTAGTPFSIQLKGIDVYGNSGGTFQTVSVDLISPVGIGEIQGTLATPQTASGSIGIATLGNLTVNNAGTGFQLRATSPGVPVVTSALFNILPGPPVKLAFPAVPNPPPVPNFPELVGPVTAQDAYSNVALQFTGNVTLGFGNNPTGAILIGQTTVPAVSGAATFQVAIDKPGNGYTFTVNSPGLPEAISPPFSVLFNGAAYTLNFTSPPPSSATAGAPFTPSVVVTARDAGGNTAVNFTGLVTLGLGNNPGGGTLALAGSPSGPIVSAVAGVAAFSGGLSINKTGIGYTLTASSAGVNGATSSPVNIIPGPQTKLQVAGPATVQSGASFNLVVTVTDAFGNTVNYNGTVGVALPSNSTGKLSGTTAVVAVNGVAQLNGLSLSPAGQYTLNVFNAGLTTTFSITVN
jgi:hypothetical protein